MSTFIKLSPVLVAGLLLPGGRWVPPLFDSQHFTWNFLLLLLLLLNAVTAKVRLTNNSVKTISRIFVYLIREIYVQLTWRIFSRQYNIFFLSWNLTLWCKRFPWQSVQIFGRWCKISWVFSILGEEGFSCCEQEFYSFNFYLYKRTYRAYPTL